MKEDLQILLSSDDKNESDHFYPHGLGDDIPRTGTLWTAVAHIITAVIGAGVLSLAWSIAQLGWIVGPAVMLVFAVVTYFTSCLLADFYRSPDPVTGSRNSTYKGAVQANLENGRFYGSLGGIISSTTISEAQKVWRIFQAVGDIAFAYSFSIILIEIEDTLKSTPPENKTMKKATLISVIATTAFYMLCGCFGYAAFGENAPGNLLTGFGFYEPYWLIDFADACVVVHLVGAYQVFCQPLFAFIEGWFSRKWPSSGFINRTYVAYTPCFGSCDFNLFRLCCRTAFVVSTTGISMLFPSFNDVLGISGAVTFWPLVVYFPVEMYIARNKLQCWTSKWFLFQSFSFICLLVSLAAAIGSIEGLIKG